MTRPVLGIHGIVTGPVLGIHGIVTWPVLGIHGIVTGPVLGTRLKNDFVSVQIAKIVHF